MTDHAWQDCPNTQRITDLERWQTAQNGHLRSIDACLGDLKEAEARRAGAEAMLKWILGFAGVGSITGIISLIVNLAT
jgi:hypothetical protein